MDKYIYISIPKTGTNSIHEIMKNTNYNHITSNTIKTMIGEKNYNSKESFCFIRNPIDLVKSWYFYHKYNPRVPKNEGNLFYPDTIEEWVFKMNCNTHWQKKEHKKNNPNWDINESPIIQSNWIKDKNGNIIVKKIFPFDNINLEIEKLFGIKPTVINKSSKDDYILDIKVEDKIKEIFKKDIEFYNNLLFSNKK